MDDSVNDESNNNTSINYNKILKGRLEDVHTPMFKNLNKTNHNYENSFKDIDKFSSNYSKKQKTQIDTIVFKDSNNDGWFSAAIIYHYLKSNDKNANVTVIGVKGNQSYKPSSQLYANKNIICVDNAFSKETITDFNKIVNSMIIIDDHAKVDVPYKSVFNGKLHATTGYVFKFFYPKITTPLTVKYVDLSDSKLYLEQKIKMPGLDIFNQFVGYRYTHIRSPTPQKYEQTLTEIWDIIDGKFKLFPFFVGFYYRQVTELLKEQIAINAVMADFKGYKVGVLNYFSPALNKRVGRQIITNFKNKKIHIDFAVLWGYEYINNCYHITMIDDHKQTSINLGEMAGRLANHPKGGSGHPHIGSFYWNGNIQELITKKYI